MRRVLALTLLAACGGSGDDAPIGSITAAVTHYDYAFDLDSRLAHASVTATVSVAGDCLSLPFRADGLDPATVTLDGAPAVSATVASGALVVCGDGHREGDTLVLAVDVTIPERTLSTSQVGYSVRQDLAGNPFYYLVSWVGGCDQFGPCDNRPDQFATYTFHVSHPAAFDVRCPGTITEVSETETQCDFTHAGGPTYSTFGVAAYPAWTQTSQGQWGSVAVTLYDRTATRIAEAIDPAYHNGFVTFMESTFGAFPFGSELRVLTAPTYWSGFEHPGNIVLDDRLASGTSAYAQPVAHVLDHEIAHQWAGDQTTIADTYDFVWKESMAEYLAYIYEDTVDPAVALKTAIAWKGFSNGAGFFPVPAEKPALFDYYGDVYGPGPMILFRQIEVLSSRAQVIAALQSVLGQPRALSVDELVAALETSTGLALADYAAAWIYGTGAPDWPEFTTTFTAGAGTSTLSIVQTNPSNRTCKFHVALVGASSEQTNVEVDTFHNGTTQTLTVPTPAYTVTRVDLDPLRECLVFPKLGTVARRVGHPWVGQHSR
ncbi:MAG: M1 family aminopeptidase [Kofleriaceae bacterium]